MEKNKDRRLELAKLMEVAYRGSQKEKEHIAALNLKKCTGKNILNTYETYFNKLPVIESYIKPCGITLDDFFTGLGEWLYENNYSPQRDTSVVRGIFKSESACKTIAIFIHEKKETRLKLQQVMVSILNSIKYISLYTLRINRMSKPSLMIQSMIESGSIERYIGTKLSYHFMSLIPDICDIIEKYAQTHIEVDDFGKCKKVMNPEYSDFLKKFCEANREAKLACKQYGMKIGVLAASDIFYHNHQKELNEEILKERQNAPWIPSPVKH